MVISRQPLYTLGFYIIAFIIYFSTISTSYYYHNNQFYIKKNEILQEYYQIIFNHSLIKFTEILNKLPFDQSGKYTTLKIEKSDIIACHKDKCIRRNLFEFSSILDKYTPDYIYYKIDVNKQLLHRNYRLDNYQLEKNHHINDQNQLLIFISINSRHLNEIHKKALEPFIISVIASTFFLILFIILNRLSITHFKNFYSMYYKKLSNSQLEQIKECHKNEIFIKESSLMKKIWNLEYSKDRDSEFNRVFSQKANQLAMLLQEEEYSSEHYDHARASHCTIILYQKNIEKIQITTKAIVEKFTDRFSNSEENISINISSSCHKVTFFSSEFLYQIIYSIINCIIFMLKDQANSAKYNISFDISNNNGKLNLLCSYDGLIIDNEPDLLMHSNRFLKNNANPFCVGINQIFHILKKDNFECIVGRNSLNFIKISDMKINQVKNKENNNIIQFKP